MRNPAKSKTDLFIADLAVIGSWLCVLLLAYDLFVGWHKWALTMLGCIIVFRFIAWDLKRGNKGE